VRQLKHFDYCGDTEVWFIIREENDKDEDFYSAVFEGLVIPAIEKVQYTFSWSKFSSTFQHNKILAQNPLWDFH